MEDILFQFHDTSGRTFEWKRVEANPWRRWDSADSHARGSNSSVETKGIKTELDRTGQDPRLTDLGGQMKYSMYPRNVPFPVPYEKGHNLKELQPNPSKADSIFIPNSFEWIREY